MCICEGSVTKKQNWDLLQPRGLLAHRICIINALLDSPLWGTWPWPLWSAWKTKGIFCTELGGMGLLEEETVWLVCGIVVWMLYSCKSLYYNQRGTSDFIWQALLGYWNQHVIMEVVSWGNQCFPLYSEIETWVHMPSVCNPNILRWGFAKICVVDVPWLYIWKHWENMFRSFNISIDKQLYGQLVIWFNRCGQSTVESTHHH